MIPVLLGAAAAAAAASGGSAFGKEIGKSVGQGVTSIPSRVANFLNDNQDGIRAMREIQNRYPLPSDRDRYNLPSDRGVRKFGNSLSPNEDVDDDEY
jgi:hypothetical protein